MSHASWSFREITLDRGCPDTERARAPAQAEPPRPSAGTLQRIVRRILRTQSRRTGFEARVLDEARRLIDSQHVEVACETLERLVVSRLLGERHSEWSELAAQPADAACPATQLRVFNSTLAWQPAR